MLRLKQRLPITWTSPTTLRVGVEPPAVELAVSDDEARAINAMREGTSKAALTRAVGRRRAAELLLALGPLLETGERTMPRVRVSGESSLADAVRALVRGARVSSGSDPATVLMPVCDWRVSERMWQRYLATERTCLPVVVGDQTVTVGPLWDPPASACWKCAHPSPPHPLPLPEESALAVRLDALEEALVVGCAAEVLRRLRDGSMQPGEEAVLHREHGSVSWRRVEPDPECACRFELSELPAIGGTSKEPSDCAPMPLSESA